MRDGLVVVDKPAGCTSHDVVAKLRKVYGQRRVGHAGTLDPDATGVLLVGLGRATRLLRYLSESGKAYRGRVVFGIATSTLDAAGEVVDQRPMPITSDDVERALPAFVGDIEQLPPMVSAVKVGGRRLHELARAGEEVERAPRPVHVDGFDARVVRARRVPGGHVPGRVRERHLRAHARRRPRRRARWVRAPRGAAAAARRLVHARRRRGHWPTSRLRPTRPCCPLARRHARSRTCRRRRRTGRAVSHGRVVRVPARWSCAATVRTRWSVPTAPCSRSTTQRGAALRPAVVVTGS